MTSPSPSLQAGDRAPPFRAQPVSGLPVEVPAPSGPVVVFFVPYLGSPVCRQTLAELQDRYAEFDREGARVVAITPSRLALARDFVPRHHLLFPLVTDEDGRLARDWRIGRDRWLTSTLRGLHRVSLRRAARAFRHGHGPIDGPPRQLGAEFVIDAEGRLAYARYSCSILDGPDLDALLACVTP